MNIITRTELNDNNIVKISNESHTISSLSNECLSLFVLIHSTWTYGIRPSHQKRFMKEQHTRITGKWWTIVVEKKRWGRWLKLLREVYEETRLRVGYHMVCQIIGESRKLGNKKQEKRVTQLRMKRYCQCKQKVK